MKLYTKTGDDGKTGLIGGQRVDKDDARVASYGDVDELNATIGVSLAAVADAAWRDTLAGVQRDLFALGSELATPEGTKPPARLNPNRINEIEVAIDATTGEMAPLTNFVLPGGCPLAAALHLSRTVCRRAERGMVTLARVSAVSTDAIAYLNRLGDLLFAKAVVANQRAGVPNTIWTGNES